ncbi:MAG: hypothetical protein E7559_00325 [Ruminococcaceae bacterium]|nr:hypothetical protein [Oscillospiraceae bacterium]
MKRKAEAFSSRSLHQRKGLRALMGAGALLALGLIIALCITHCVNPEKVIARAEHTADNAVPLGYSFTYNAGTPDAPDEHSVIVSSKRFIRRGGEVQSIEGVYYDIDWSDEVAAFSLKKLPEEQQDTAALRRWKTIRMTALVLPWLLASLLLLAVFRAISCIVERDLKTLEEVAIALEKDRRGGGH